MAAKKGNKTAEKWNKQVTLRALNAILVEIEKKKIVYLSIALANLDLYNDIWAYWERKFENDTDVFRIIKNIEEKIHANLVDQALHHKVNSAVAIFVLKNKYKWSDKQQIDHTSNGESIVWNENKTYKSIDEKGSR